MNCQPGSVWSGAPLVYVGLESKRVVQGVRHRLPSAVHAVTGTEPSSQATSPGWFCSVSALSRSVTDSR